MDVQPDQPLARVTAPDLDAILGQKLRCLDDGFVRVVDYLGSDSSIVQAARISYGAGTRTVHEDRGLIRYLLRHRHTTPFEMCEIKLHVRVPMDTWRQWIRHRTANVNEYSTRYSVAIDTAQRTSPDSWRVQSQLNRQGSDRTLDATIGERLSAREADLQQLAREVYQERLDAGVAREQARKDLPLSTYTEAYWKNDLWNLLHFLDLRMDAHAQEEIREYANLIGKEIVARWVPITWEAFRDYRLKGVSLSEAEVTLISLLLAGDPERARQHAASLGWLPVDPVSGRLRRHRERDEFLEKLRTRFGFTSDWLSASQKSAVRRQEAGKRRQETE
jgi:thymidylate synthase (FAD)